MNIADKLIKNLLFDENDCLFRLTSEIVNVIITYIWEVNMQYKTSMREFDPYGSVYEEPKGKYSYHELCGEPIQEDDDDFDEL